MAYEKDENELGALWVKESARGEFMTGTINGEAVAIFRNDRKAPGSKAPDWRVMKARPKDTPSPREQRYGRAGRPVFDDPNDPGY